MLFVILMFAILGGCDRQKDQELTELDLLLKTDAHATLERLNKIDPSQLRHSDLCYYYLLKASAIDRSFTGLKNEDSELRISKKHFEKKEDYYNLARTEYYIAKCLRVRDSLQAAHMMLREAKDHFEKTDQSDPHLGGLIYYQLGCTESGPDDVPASKVYFEKSEEMFSKANDTIAVLYSMAQVVRIESYMRRLTKADSVATKLLQRIDSLKNVPAKQLADIKTYAYYNISYLYQIGTDKGKALTFTRKTIETYQQAGFDVQPDLYQGMAQIFQSQRQIDSARYYYDLAVDTIYLSKFVYSVALTYWEWANMEEELGNYKEASRLKEKFAEAMDIWHKTTSNHSLIVLEKSYEIAKRERAILEERNEKLVIFIVVLNILLLIVIILLFIRRYHKRLKINLDQLSQDVQHTRWGFLVAKELMSANRSSYKEVDRILTKNRVPLSDPRLYQELNDLFIEGREEYSTRLFATLTNFDELFIKNLLEKYPKLNSEDIVAAAMVRHRWSIPDIAAVFQINEDAARKRRSRLKNKVLGKDADLEHLEDYLWELNKDDKPIFFKKSFFFRRKKAPKKD